MKKRLVPLLVLAAYCAVLIKVVVFKSVPALRTGRLMINFGGTESGHPANLVPFATIIPYFLGDKGLIIAGINIIGNVALLVPLGFLLSFVCPGMTWKKAVALAIASGFSIEMMQAVLRVGIFDIDDVILNALGVMIGYGMFIFFTRRMRKGDKNKSQF